MRSQKFVSLEVLNLEDMAQTNHLTCLYTPCRFYVFHQYWMYDPFSKEANNGTFTNECKFAIRLWRYVRGYTYLRVLKRSPKHISVPFFAFSSLLIIHLFLNHTFAICLVHWKAAWMGVWFPVNLRMSVAKILRNSYGASFSSFAVAMGSIFLSASNLSSINLKKCRSESNMLRYYLQYQ